MYRNDDSSSTRPANRDPSFFKVAEPQVDNRDMEWISEDFLRLFERDTVFLPIPLVLAWIPLELHEN